jgi:hypothetical protein
MKWAADPMIVHAMGYLQTGFNPEFSTTLEEAGIPVGWIHIEIAGRITSRYLDRGVESVVFSDEPPEAETIETRESLSNRVTMFYLIGGGIVIVVPTAPDAPQE